MLNLSHIFSVGYEKHVHLNEPHVSSNIQDIPDSKVHGANIGPTWVLSAPDGPHVGPMNLAIRDAAWWLHAVYPWHQGYLLITEIN